MLQARPTGHPLTVPGFRMLLAALAISQLGDWLYNVALVVVVHDRTGSAAWVGATTAARVLPVVLLSPLGGMIADRFDRRLVMVVADTLRLLAMLGLAAVTWAHLPVILLPLLAASASVAASPYPSAVAASVPRLVPRESLVAASALRSGVGSTAVVAGPLLGAVTLTLFGGPGAFVLNGVSFAIAALLVCLVRPGEAFAPSRGEGPREPLWADVTLGARELLRRRDAARLVGADLVCSLVYGVLSVELVAVAVRLQWASGYGVLIAAFGLGGVAGAVVTPLLTRRVGRGRVQITAFLAVVLSLPLLLTAPWAPAVLGLTALCGACSLSVEIATETALAEQLPDEVFARAYGFAFPASIAMIAVGSLVAGALG